MNKKINWKNVSLTLLIVMNLGYSLDGSNQENKINQLENELSYWINEALAQDWIIHDLENELYTLQIESGHYNEYPINEIGTRNPNN